MKICVSPGDIVHIQYYTPDFISGLSYRLFIEPSFMSNLVGRYLIIQNVRSFFHAWSSMCLVFSTTEHRRRVLELASNLKLVLGRKIITYLGIAKMIIPTPSIFHYIHYTLVKSFRFFSNRSVP